MASLAQRLYRGENSFDYIGKRRRWYSISALVLLISVVSMIFVGFNFGIDFKGGSSFQFPANGHSVADVKKVFEEHNVDDAVVTELSNIDGSKQLRVTSRELSPEIKSGATKSEQEQMEDALVAAIGVKQTELNPTNVGASWGSQITKKAAQGLVVFLISVMAYIALRFEPKMAAAAIVALLHDLVITAGIYALVGFEVTPSTVIALLTILGFSLYDTVVVFDKVRENTAGIGSASRMTYSEAANLAMNQTIMRSINTSLIALLPVAALLFVGAGLLGAGTLKDLALAQFIGLASGAYSSIFVATPLLCDLKEREPAMKALTAKVARRHAAEGTTPGSVAPVLDAEGALVHTPLAAAAPARQRSHRDQLREQGKKAPKGRKR